MLGVEMCVKSQGGLSVFATCETDVDARQAFGIAKYCTKTVLPAIAKHMSKVIWYKLLKRFLPQVCVGRTELHRSSVQWSEDKIKADPFLRRSRVRFRVPPWVSNLIARDHLA